MSMMLAYYLGVVVGGGFGYIIGSRSRGTP